MFISTALSFIEYKLTNFNVIIRQQCHLVTFPVSRRPSLARQSVSSTFRAGDARYYAPPVNFYQESGCMKLTLVTYASPISILWNSVDGGAFHRRADVLLAVKRTSGFLLIPASNACYGEEVGLEADVFPEWVPCTFWGGHLWQQCIIQHYTSCMASDCCFPLQLSFEIVSGAWQRSGGRGGCAGDAQGG